MEEEFTALMARFEGGEALSDDEMARMDDLAWYLGKNGLLNPEEDAYHGAKERWSVEAAEAKARILINFGQEPIYRW